MSREPAPGPQVAVADHGGHAFEEVLHEAGAVGRGGDHAGAEQQRPAGHTPAENDRNGSPRRMRSRIGAANRLDVDAECVVAELDTECRTLARLRLLTARRLAGWGRLAGFQRVQFLARLEADGFAGGDADLGAGAGIAADAGFAGADAEDAKSAQFDALAGGQSLLEALEDRIHGGLRLGARQARALDHMMDDVLLNQRGNLAGAGLV